MGKPEDIFDVVNERDEVTGRAPRSEVHAKRLFHRAVHIWAFNAKGEVLLQLRTPTKDRHPNTWDSSVSGHVDAGEDYDTTARREWTEELGCADVPPMRSLGKTDACEETGEEFVMTYATHHEGPFKPCPEEITELKWITPKELTAWMKREPKAFAPAFVHLWESYASLTGG